MSLDPGQDIDNLSDFPTGTCDRCERRFPLATAKQDRRWQPACAPWPAKRGAPDGAWFCCDKCCADAKRDADESGWTAEQLAKLRESRPKPDPHSRRGPLLAVIAGLAAFGAMPPPRRDRP